MQITFAKYRVKRAPNGIEFWRGMVAIIDGVEMYLPLEPGNRHYDEIMRQVDSGDLVIEEPDPFQPTTNSTEGNE